MQILGNFINWIIMKNQENDLIAFVHDWIFHIGWAEAVFFDLIKQYTHLDKDEKIYTLFSDREDIDIDGYTYEIVTALPWWLNRLFVRWSSPTDPDMQVAGEEFVKKFFDYRNLIVLYPQLCRLLRRKIMSKKPRKLIISSFAAVKNIIPYGASRPMTEVILYLHSPNQYIRENYDEYRNKFASRQRLIFDSIVPYLRTRDSKHRQYNTVITNSEYTAQLAQTHYKIQHSLIQYPLLDPKFATTVPAASPRDYFLYLGRLTTFVREVDKIIELCNALHIPLIIAGSGPDEAYLKSIAGPTITFVWSITDVDEKIELIKYARWLINLSLESCGIATMEALALWVPVFGYNAGGTAELVWPDQWVLVHSKESKSLKAWFATFINNT